ncbi:hypothetical protein LCGC14_1127190 [marine sediment metagenome]|uniref:Uncharacterized protein n=1 Tax=marine sediment metagenome TaxID=412755 RepID=A0A0F9M286_9ZZZZ
MKTAIGEKSFCTSCEKGLLFVVEAIISGTNLKKLRLCSVCRKILEETVKEAFATEP